MYFIFKFKNSNKGSYTNYAKIEGYRLIVIFDINDVFIFDFIFKYNEYTYFHYYY